MNNVAINTVKVGTTFAFPKGNRQYTLEAIEDGMAIYSNPKGDTYDMPETHMVRLNVDTKASKKPKATQKAFKPKEVNVDNDLNAIEARVASLETGMEDIATSIALISEAIKDINELLMEK